MPDLVVVREKVSREGKSDKSRLLEHAGRLLLHTAILQQKKFLDVDQGSAK